MTLYTVKEVAKMLKISTRTVHRKINEGKLKAQNLDGTIRITQENLNNYILGR
jgi:excisionase family DNA binding protein